MDHISLSSNFRVLILIYKIPYHKHIICNMCATKPLQWHSSVNLIPYIFLFGAILIFSALCSTSLAYGIDRAINTSIRNGWPLTRSKLSIRTYGYETFSIANTNKCSSNSVKNKCSSKLQHFTLISSLPEAWNLKPSHLQMVRTSPIMSYKRV